MTRRTRVKRGRPNPGNPGPTPIVAPTGLTATDDSDSINLAWTPSTTPGVTEQRIYRGVGAGGTLALLATVASSATSHDDTTASVGVTYRYTVRAFDGSNESVDSTAATATIDSGVPAGDGTAIRVNGGAAGSLYTDANGDVWFYDAGLVSTTTATDQRGSSISGTTDDALYTLQRYATLGNLTYAFPCANGDYTVTLHLCETYVSGAGERVVNVVINGVTRTANLDVFSAAGGKFAAYTPSYGVTVSGGVITITLERVVQNPTLAGIEIIAGEGGSLAPLVGNVVATPNVSDLTVTWNTDVPATSEVLISETSGSGYTTYPGGGDATADKTSHSVVITGLTAGTRYYYKVVSENDDAVAKETDETSIVYGVEVTTLTISPNFNTIGIELLFAGDDNRQILGKFQQITTTGATATSATSVPIGGSVPMSMKSGTIIRFLDLSNRTARTVTLSGDVARGATSLPISAAAAGFASGSIALISAMRYRESGATNWEMFAPFWPTYYTGTEANEIAIGNALYGKVHNLTEDTEYEIQFVTLPGNEAVGDPNSVMYPTTHTVSTRATPTRAAASLYLSPSGNDTTGDGSSGSPYRTMTKAISVASSSVQTTVEMAPGTYESPGGVITKPVHFTAENRARDDDGDLIDVSLRTIIQKNDGYQGKITPPDSGVWVQQASFTGPVTGVTITDLWKWTGGAVGHPDPDYQYLAFSATANDVPRIFGGWKRKGGTQTPNTSTYAGQTFEQTTIAGWAEIIKIGANTRYAWTRSGSDIYAFFPPGITDPNDWYWHWSINRDNGDFGHLYFGGANQGIDGCELRFVHTLFGPLSTNGYAHHNHSVHCGVGTPGYKPNNYAQGMLAEYNTFLTNGTWEEDDPTNFPPIPWNSIKGGVRFGTWESGEWIRMFNDHEVSGCGGIGGGRHCVYRHNIIDGWFNGWGAFNDGFNRYACENTDLHDNIFRNIADDAIEPENRQINLSCWNNDISDATVAFSLGPTKWGPIYLYRNRCIVTNEFAGRNILGDIAARGGGFKYSGASEPRVLVLNINNTFASTQGRNFSGADGGQQAAGGGPSPEAFWFRNCITRMTRYAFNMPSTPTITWDEDFNAWATYDNDTQTSRGLSGYRNISSYRTAFDDGDHSNVLSNGTSFNISDYAALDACFTDIDAHDLTLANTSADLIDMGIPVPNFTVTWSGNAPDLGYEEEA